MTNTSRSSEKGIDRQRTANDLFRIGTDSEDATHHYDAIEDQILVVDGDHDFSHVDDGILRYACLEVPFTALDWAYDASGRSLSEYRAVVESCGREWIEWDVIEIDASDVHEPLCAGH